ncbi:hypothetical protein [Pyrococcus yayanosii]|uniref:Uncharacterized protein n=1 Tax=Pyrococcus yayanosii (strain CH1 / JCM 16557) TaxID=529709 RepID=F8AIL8_PYRYC|nr:hypothetical protein [Pyrococcus yayanosii]AEH24386.1 hypothetical protein PYCH_06980 [Pyrococcus yayanosii CH1]
MGERDGWERFSSGISSLSINLLSTLLFILVLSYVLTWGLKGAELRIPVSGQVVTMKLPDIGVPMNVQAIRSLVIYLFGTILLGLPMPLFPEKLKPLKALVALLQAGTFVYALYVFVRAILDFAAMLA